MNETNPSMLAASILMDELARSGLRQVVVSPGSRSAPLALASAHHPELRTHVVLDERSAAYFALGAARASGLPVAVVTTSGTAAANLMPAVVEASQANVPLLAVTADRPWELQDVGANQVIPQERIFGAFPRWTSTIPPLLVEELQVRALRQTACKAFAMARQGPVHVNVMFREPLAPLPTGMDLSRLSASARRGRIDHRPWMEADVGQARMPQRMSERWRRTVASGRGLVVLGPGAGDLGDLAVPVVADALSGAKGHAVDAFLGAVADRLKPDWIVQLGSSPTSKAVREALAEWDVPRLVVADGRMWDETGGADVAVAARSDVEALLAGAERNNDWLDLWTRLARSVPGPEGDWEGPVAGTILDALGPDDTLWVGSSLPVRDVERYRTGPARIRANRGASGIDGVLSSAAGAATHGRVVAYVGDLTFLHDIGGLPAIRANDVTVVVLNNRGGRIFEHLPVAAAVDRLTFEALMAAPQDVDIGRLCHAYGIAHVRLEGTRGLREAMGRPGVVEVVVDPAVAVRRRKEHLAQAHAAARAVVGRNREDQPEVPESP